MKQREIACTLVIVAVTLVIEIVALVAVGVHYYG